MVESLSRRAAILGIAGFGFGISTYHSLVAAEKVPVDAAIGIQQLKDGNARFISGKTRHAHESAEWRKQLVGGQTPFATIIGCSDSRVPIELVFDQGFGDLFVVRVAGNVVAPDVVGTLAYAVEHLRTPLVVVLGHEGCGAVTAAIAQMQKPTEKLPSLQLLLKMIETDLPRPLLQGTNEEVIRWAVEANVRASMRKLANLPQAARMLATKEVTLLGAVYDLATGGVRFLDPA